MRSVCTAALAAVLVTTTVGLAGAQTGIPNHLECFPLQVKGKQWVVDEHAFDAFTVRPILPALGLDRGCELLPKKNPRPKEICVPAEKAPHSGSFGSGLSEEAMLCYAARCDAGLTDQALAVAGPFGSGSSIVRSKQRNRRLCVPAAVCHDVCEEGGPLHRACSPCVARVCATDPFCCAYGWYSFCAARAVELCGESCPGVPTPSPSPVWTPSPVPTASPVPTPTSVPGAPCSTAKVTITIGYDPLLFPEVAGVVVGLSYPLTRMGIPGFGSDPRVIERVVFLSDVTGGLVQVADDDFGSVGLLNVGMVNLFAWIPPGPFAAATFDCEGDGGPNLVDLGCTVDASTFAGDSVPTSCSLTLETTPR